MLPDSLRMNQTSRRTSSGVLYCSYRTPLHRTYWWYSRTRCRSLALALRVVVLVRVVDSLLRSARHGSCFQHVKKIGALQRTTQTDQLASSSLSLDGLQKGRSAHTNRMKC